MQSCVCRRVSPLVLFTIILTFAATRAVAQSPSESPLNRKTSSVRTADNSQFSAPNSQTQLFGNFASAISSTAPATSGTSGFPVQKILVSQQSWIFRNITKGPSIPAPPTLHPDGTFLSHISNNTSACSPSNDPSTNRTYCFSFFNGNSTNPIDIGAQTELVNSPARHVSHVSLHDFMGSGWKGKFICEYQPWFGMSTHLSVGYNANLAATVAAQNSNMIARGCDINFVDWYGATSPNQAFNLATANQIFANLKSRPGYPLKFAVLEDKDGLKYSCPVSGKTEAQTVLCLTDALIRDMDYIHTNYAWSPVYWRDGGQPVVGSFVTRSQWPVLTSADWTLIWSAVKLHTDTYEAPFKYVLQFGSFTSDSYDNGRYAWVKTSPYTTAAQFWWGSDTGPTPSYLDSFYSAARANPQKLAIGVVFKGFDDNNASWSNNRVRAQQCGQVLINSVKEAAKYFGGSNPQIPYMQVATWNDYEEGTEVETGVDNCYSVRATLSGSKLSWSLISSDPSYSSTSTIHHFKVYFADSKGDVYVAANLLPVSTHSFDLSKVVPQGTWTVYVEMIGQPLIINQMSNPQTYIK